MSLLTYAPARHAYAPFKVALISGLSDPSTCALSDVQSRFFEQLDVAASAKVTSNFPYVPCDKAFTPPPLWLASVRNYSQFRRASQRTFIDDATRHYDALRNSTDALLFIALSCGLEFLRNIIDADDAVHVLAVGPVARGLPPVRCTLVQGTRDPISRFFFSKPDVVLNGIGHMNYLQTKATIDIANIVCSNISKSSAAASISRTAN